MNPLTSFVRSLGNDRAVANARAVLEARQREDRLIAALAARLDGAAATESPAAAAA